VPTQEATIAVSPVLASIDAASMREISASIFVPDESIRSRNTAASRGKPHQGAMVKPAPCLCCNWDGRQGETIKRASPASMAARIPARAIAVTMIMVGGNAKGPLRERDRTLPRILLQTNRAAEARATDQHRTLLLHERGRPPVPMLSVPFAATGRHIRHLHLTPPWQRKLEQHYENHSAA
jgi:hypothetical protein